jgi:hypothetical protein
MKFGTVEVRDRGMVFMHVGKKIRTRASLLRLENLYRLNRALLRKIIKQKLQGIFNIVFLCYISFLNLTAPSFSRAVFHITASNGGCSTYTG